MPCAYVHGSLYSHKTLFAPLELFPRYLYRLYVYIDSTVLEIVVGHQTFSEQNLCLFEHFLFFLVGKHVQTENCFKVFTSFNSC